MAAGLKIFEQEIEVPPDPAVRRGAFAIAGLAAIIGGTGLLIGAVGWAVMAGIVWLLTQPSQVDAYHLTQIRCTIVGDQLRVETRVEAGEAYDPRIFITGYEWEPVIAERVGRRGQWLPGDVVWFVAPADRAEEIDALTIGLGAGEPAIQQRVAVSVERDRQRCTATIG